MVKMTKTYSIKPTEVSRKWLLIDAGQLPLGRTAVIIAKYLTGKHKPSYTPHIDGGDYVVVINAAQVPVTGNKEIAKKYYRHSGYPGSISDLTLGEIRAKNPERLITSAVQGMLPKNKLMTERLKRLKVFAGSEHSHAPQKPQKVKE